MTQPDFEWNKFGELDPYFSVITDKNYKKEHIDEKALNAFFQSGDEYVESVMKRIHTIMGTHFHPKHTMDFGCGVGRLVIPFAKYSGRVLGVDVSGPMIAEAEKNCRAFGITNVELVKDMIKLRKSGETFDLIHSYNVLQHIPTHKGLVLIKSMTDMLEEDGIGVLHFPFHCTSKLRTLFSIVMRRVPFAHNFWNLYKKRAWSYPHMQMNIYDLNTIFRIIGSSNCDIRHTQFVRQGDYETVILYFGKQK